MSYYDKDYKILLELYRTVYAELSVDFDTLDKVDGFYMDYYMDDEEQRKIVEQVLSKYKLQLHQKNGIMNAYWLGVAPTGSKIRKREDEHI